MCQNQLVSSEENKYFFSSDTKIHLKCLIFIIKGGGVQTKLAKSKVINKKFFKILPLIHFYLSILVRNVLKQVGG